MSHGSCFLAPDLTELAGCWTGLGPPWVIFLPYKWGRGALGSQKLCESPGESMCLSPRDPCVSHEPGAVFHVRGVRLST